MCLPKSDPMMRIILQSPPTPIHPAAHIHSLPRRVQPTSGRQLCCLAINSKNSSGWRGINFDCNIRQLDCSLPGRQLLIRSWTMPIELPASFTAAKEKNLEAFKQEEGWTRFLSEVRVQVRAVVVVVVLVEAKCRTIDVARLATMADGRWDLYCCNHACQSLKETLKFF